MAVTEYKFAGTAASVDRDSKNAWVNPDYAKADDTNYASNVVGKNTYTDWLRLTNFGFTSSDLPSGCTINGIEFIVCRYSEQTDAHSDSALYLRATSGQVGSNMASATKWPITTPTEATYGGSTNMCGTSLTQSDIISTDFGIDLSVVDSSNTLKNIFVDYIKIRVYYTVAGGGSLLTPRNNFRHMIVR